MTDAMIPANAPQMNVSNGLSSGVPSSEREVKDTLIRLLNNVPYYIAIGDTSSRGLVEHNLNQDIYYLEL